MKTMILADKILKLRKQSGWSQEELADKMNVSRQSVSKWESASSIPDLNKVILLTEIFGVTTDYLLKDEIEEVHTIVEDKEQNIIRISLEEATQYVDTKIEMTKRISRGVILCVYSVVPLLFLLAMAEGSWIDMTPSLAIATGLVLLLILVSFGVSYFIRSNQYEIDFTKFEEEEFELEYGVRGIYKRKHKLTAIPSTERCL